MTSPFGTADFERLAAAGIPESEARRQLELLRHPPAPARLRRPATLGDGVLRLPDERLAELEQRGRAARDAGRLAKFVPASGAASRMFRALAAVRARGLAADPGRLAERVRAGDADAATALEFARELPRMALAVSLAAELGVDPRELARRALESPLEPILAALLDPGRLGAMELPKALLGFHTDGDRIVTAFEEQLVEGVPYLADRNGVARFHFTIPPGRDREFQRALDQARMRIAADGVRLEVAFSVQSPATDTLALDERERPARGANGELLLRPSGHGALLGNLGATGGDLVVVKNIDNVLPRSRHAEIARWQLILAGLAAETEERLEAPPSRPLRVCGVVPSAGEPGGGPFWTAGADGGESLQLVEFSQVDAGEPDQLAIWSASTHFNPVDLVVSLRDPQGRGWPLQAFVDPASAFVSRKSEGGRTLLVLERPGLWNGAMAGWRSLFVEVPGATFAPVKTVLDLARTAHATTPK